MEKKRLLLPRLINILMILALFLPTGLAGARQAELAGTSPTLQLSSAFTPRLVPLGNDQSQLRHAYQSVFAAVADGQAMAWTAANSSYQGKTYPAGTMAGLQGLPSGNFDSVPTDGAYEMPLAQFLYPARIAVFYSDIRDSAGQVVSWEEATFETLFRVYLQGADYFDTINDAKIGAGGLKDYDILILPSITIGYVKDVADKLGPTGLAALKAWVEAGGILYAQGDGAYLVEAAGLVPEGTVNLDQRLVDLAPFDGLAGLNVLAPENSLTYSWLSQETYILDDPVLSVSADPTVTPNLTVVASYADTSVPNTPAIVQGFVGQGQVILTNAHPSARQSTYPLVMDALFTAMSQRVGLFGSVHQDYSTLLPPDTIPAYEADIPVHVTTQLMNAWDLPISAVTVTETLQPGFTVAAADVTPLPASITPGADGTVIVWQMSDVPKGITTLEYTARTLADTMKGGVALVSKAKAEYADPITTQNQLVNRNPLWIKALMPARLNGDRDIELDGLYPLPAAGSYFDIALTLENKNETSASNIVVTDVVALLSPVVDVQDQRIIPKVATGVPDPANPGQYLWTDTTETAWVKNEVFFYNNASYPLPEGVASNTDVFNLSNWDGVTFYTLPNELNQTVSIPAGYESMIKVLPDGKIQLPAVKLTWNYGALQGYDYQDPAVRYGLFSQELLGRQVSFESDPDFNQGVILNTSGGTVFTCLGGDPIPYHEYLSSGVVVVPISPVKTQVAYDDAWARPHSLDLRTVSYDIVPFPPPEYHAVVNTTFDMNVDFDGDGKRTDPVLEYPSRLPADLHLLIKSHSNFAPGLDLQKDETLISQGMFKGLGYEITPANGTWQDSWKLQDLQGKGPDATVLSNVVDSPDISYLYFQQALDAQKSEAIDLYATLDASKAHKEGVLKINDGARFVYHQKAVGPSRYEVFDSHVQAVFGLRSDAQVTKQVAPVRVATYGDNIYHFLKVEDPWEPRLFAEDPYIQSYGFGDMAATVYVGGRHQRDLLWSRVSPGDSTQIRLEVTNNSGTTLTNVLPVPVAPDGITVTLRSAADTEKIEPLFFDFPFLNATSIPDAWKGVYYFDVKVDPSFAGKTGQVYAIDFTLQGDNVPAKFKIPAAKIGIKDTSGNVYTVFGPSVDLELQDDLPEYVALRDARIANETEMQAMMDAINYDDAHPGSDTAATLFATLRAGVQTQTTPSDKGNHLAMTLPTYAQTMPWDDLGQLAKTLYVILYSDITAETSGTNTADWEPTVSFVDSFGQPQSDQGNAQAVEVRGANLTVAYTLHNSDGSVIPEEEIYAGMENDLRVEGAIANQGDDIAANALVTYTLPQGVTAVSADPPWQSATSTSVTWNIGDLGPGAQRTVWLNIKVTPDASSTLNAPVPLITRADSHFLNTFAQRTVDAQIGGDLTGHVVASQVYSNDFEKNVGVEWSLGGTSLTPSGRRFLGEFNNQSVALSLPYLPRHSQVRVEFDLYILRSWDGNQVKKPTGLPGASLFAPQTNAIGPDIWEANVQGGPQLVYTTFANWNVTNATFQQSYPGTYPGGDFTARTGATESGSLGYSYYQITNMDSVYHMSFTFNHSDKELTLNFLDHGLQPKEDEAWGLDNLRVTVVPDARMQFFIPLVQR